MKRVTVAILSALALVVALVATPAEASPTPAPENDRVDVYTGELTADQARRLPAVGLDHEDISITKGKGGKVSAEVLMNGPQARALQAQGVDLDLKKVDGKTMAEVAAAEPDGVYRPYTGAGNIREEILNAAAAHSDIAQAVDVGTSVQGKPITAIRVTKNARALRHASRPTVLYQATQHAREWITPETVRRLLHHYLNNYGKNSDITRIVDTTEVWFLPVVNVDGYDHTFTPGNRFWRKNLRDNNNDGQITSQDGVDPNRNFPQKWGYDNEGSVPTFTGQTYRGAGPGSEPETQAQIGLVDRIRPKFIINWHSAAELLLHGVSWQTLTRSPDDLIHDAILGDIDTPAVKEYTPELGAQLYTVNGDTISQMDNAFGALTVTPEQARCDTAANRHPDDEWTVEDCGSGTGRTFAFPDDEELIQEEFQNNLNYAISVAKSAHDPDHPVSPIGRKVPDFQIDKFSTSYSSNQPVASYIRRSLKDKRMNYRIGGGRTQSVNVSEWKGGERYGRDGTHYFAEYRGTVTGARPGSNVTVWFSGVGERGKVNSAAFTYKVRDRAGADVLVIADEDYTGVNPTYPPSVTAPKYAQSYVDALRANGIRAAVWDVDRDGVPHHLGALRHFDAAVWYLGDNRLTQDDADEPTSFQGQQVPDGTVADREKDLTLSVRDYMNEGGKLLYTGETVGYFGPLSGPNGGGIYYGLKGHPERPCVVIDNPRDDCELHSNDFAQYYLGVFGRAPQANPTSVTGTAAPLNGISAAFGGAPDNPLNEAGGLQVTSSVLPPAQFPLFTSSPVGNYAGLSQPVTAAVATEDTVTFGFGLEQVQSPTDRTKIIGQVMNYLINRNV